MTNKVLYCLLTISLAGASTLAQNTSSRPSTDKRDPSLITVTGCLQKGAQPNTFILTKVPDPLASSVAASSGGAVPTVTYQLSGGQNLAAHLGHKVEVTGKGPLKPAKAVEVTSAETKREEPAGKKTATTEVKERAAVAVRPLAVESVRMVSTDCAGQ